jgi:hypothetical protein
VERAAGAVVFAGFFEFYTAIDHIDYVEAVEQVVNKTLGN